MDDRIFKVLYNTTARAVYRNSFRFLETTTTTISPFLDDDYDGGLFLPDLDFNVTNMIEPYNYHVPKSVGHDQRPHSITTSYLHDNFFYQHIFNLSLVLIFLLQVLFVWAFLFRRRRQDNGENNMGNALFNAGVGGIMDNGGGLQAIIIHGGPNGPSGPAPAG